MKKMNFLKGIGAGLWTMAGLTAAAQTDSTRRDSTRIDTVQTHTEAMIKQDYMVTDLNTNAPIEIFYDTVNFVTLNRVTNQPVDFYVLNNADTVHGPTGLVVNGLLTRAAAGGYDLDKARVKVDGDELKIKMEDGRKIKWENGKIKVKEWGTKAKSKTDKVKMKNEWGKVKWKDGEWKVEKDT